MADEPTFEPGAVKRPFPVKAVGSVLLILLLTFLVVSNFALMRQNRDLTEALKEKLPDQFIEKALDPSTGAETNLAEAIEQWTVNEQHLHLLDEIQVQQLKLIRGLTNRVNQSAEMIRKLESQQDLLDVQAKNAALANTQRARAVLPPVEIEIIPGAVPEPLEETDPELAEGEEGLDGDNTDIDIVLEEAFDGVQVEALLSLDNPAFSGVVVWDTENQTGLIQLSNLPVLPPGFTYQLWVLDPNYDGFVDGGAFILPEASVPFEYTFRPGLEVIQAAGFAVSAESSPGTGIPNGPTVVATANLLQ